MRSLAKLLIPMMAVEALLAGQASAAVPAVEVKGAPAITTCPATSTVPTAYHNDKIVFTIPQQAGGPPLIAINAADQPALDKLPRATPLDIKVKDNPRAVADIKAKVFSFLGAVYNVDTASAIQIVSVEYSAFVCP